MYWEIADCACTNTWYFRPKFNEKTPCGSGNIKSSYPEGWGVNFHRFMDQELIEKESLI